MNINTSINPYQGIHQPSPSSVSSDQLLTPGNAEFKPESQRPVPSVEGEEVKGKNIEEQQTKSGQGQKGEGETGSEKTDLAREKSELLKETAEIRKLASRDREVRMHEQAHAAVGGQYAGSPTYDFKKGPDGINYAVSGEVGIDISKASTPEDTIQKMQVVRNAALAPAEPSAQDRKVAAQATAIAAQAQRELEIELRDESESGSGMETDKEPIAPQVQRENQDSPFPNRLNQAISAARSEEYQSHHLINEII